MKKFLLLLVKVIAFFIGWAVIGGLVTIPAEEPAVWRFFAELVPLAAVVLLSIIFWLIEKKSITIFPCKSILLNSTRSVLTGLCWLGIAVGIMLLFGAISFSGSNQIPYLWLWILSVFLNVVMQELLVRGYLYQLIKKNYGVVISTIFTTALFTAFHGGAFEAGIIPVLNVVTMSLFMTVLLEYTGSLLSPIIIHAVWNIIGATILGGVSLADDYPHLLNTTFSGNPLISGGACKIEGSIIVLILNIAFFVILTVLVRKKASSH